MKQRFQKIIKIQIFSFSFRFPKKATRKIKVKKEDLTNSFNPIQEKPIKKKILDNEVFPEPTVPIEKNWPLSKPLENYLDDINLKNILTDYSVKTNPTFTQKKKLIFENVSDCFNDLEKNQNLFPQNCISYAESLFMTLTNVEHDKISEVMKKESYIMVLNDLIHHLELSNIEITLIPVIKDRFKFTLKEVFEIDAFAPFFLFILKNFVLKNVDSMDIRNAFKVLKSWEDFFYIYSSVDYFKNQIKEIFEPLFLNINKKMDNFMFNEKISICKFMKNSRCIDSKFLDYMNVYCELNFNKLDLSDILLVLSTNKKLVVPFEMLYRLKKIILNTIKLKKINGKTLLRVVEVYSKKKIFFSENFYEIIFDEVFSESIFDSFSYEDNLLLLYYYSDSKYFDDSLFKKILRKIETSFEKLKTKNEIRLLLISLARKNFSDESFFINLHKQDIIIENLKNLEMNETRSDYKNYFQILLKQLEESSSNLQLQENLNKGTEQTGI